MEKPSMPKRSIIDPSYGAEGEFPEDRTFSLLEFNVLADAYSKEESLKHSLLSSLTWKSRGPLLITKILEHNPNIVCLVEVDKFDFFKEQLQKHGYIGFYKQKLLHKPDGVALFFKKDRFELLSNTSFTLDGGNGLPNNSWDQVALAVKLKLKTKEINNDQTSTFVVAVTHLKSNRGTDCDHIRLAQQQNLLEKLEAWDTEHSETIICGDFNYTPRSPCYYVMIKGNIKGAVMGNYSLKQLKSAPRVTLSNRMVFKSAYNLGQLAPGKEPWTRYTSKLGGTLDYIYYTQGFAVTGILSIPNRSEMPCYLPFDDFPSDHINLYCQFALK
eukprot:TRINITY_DN16688_c0_g1_i1.p1 TRINITY_DN16688_c0_g1~~TRINITY_DN16688_c0_g1_i1.p1  ORF type:complete len:328 (+),score=32.57 TRINITY_DN16688_c0_g1_i1:22-1005(+)